MKYTRCIWILIFGCVTSASSQVYNLVDELHLYMNGKSGTIENHHIMKIKPIVRSVLENPNTLLKIYSFTDESGYFDDNILVTRRRLDEMLSIFKRHNVKLQQIESYNKSESEPIDFIKEIKNRNVIVIQLFKKNKFLESRSLSVDNLSLDFGYTDLELFENGPSTKQFVIDDQGFVKQRGRLVEHEMRSEGKLAKLLVGGTVFSGLTMQRLPNAMITIDKGLLKDTLYADLNGDYSFYLSGRREVTFTISSPGHFYKEFHYTFNRDDVIEQKVLLKGIGQATKTTLRQIFFKEGTALITSSSKYSMMRLCNFMKSNPNVSIDIRGHAGLPHKDGVYSNLSAFELSLQRAKAVHDYLLKNNVDPDHLSYKGYGFLDMMHKNPKKDAQHMANRRIEIELVYE